MQNDEFGWKLLDGRYFYRAPITSIYGTPGFMPPEQELRGIVIRASDIYSFGKTLALLLLDDLFQEAGVPSPLRIALAESQLSETVSQLPKFALRALYTDAARLIDRMTPAQPSERIQDVQTVDECLMQIEQEM